jgi:DNA-directed RNA polymerase subunit L
MKGESSAEKALERAAKKVHQNTDEFIEKFSAAVTAEAES